MPFGFVFPFRPAPARVVSAAPPRVVATPLQRDADVWQRVQTGAVADSVRAHGAGFHTAVVLVAEVAWERSAGGPPPTT